MQVVNANQASTQKTKVRLREASFGDYPKIFSLQSRYGLEDSYRSWLHFWVENPVLRDVKAWPIGWVLENESKQEVVGYIGNIPQMYEIKCKKLIAAAGRSWVVDDKFRSYSMLLLDKFLRQKDAQLCLATTSNPKASPTVQALGGLRAPVGAWDEAEFWITHHPGFLASLLARNGGALNPRLTYPLSMISKLGDTIRASAMRKEFDGCEVTSCDEFDDRFDAFWRDARIGSPYLIGVRSREILEWHFKYALLENRIWIVTAENRSRIRAYSIFIRKDSPALNLTRMMLVDFQSLNRENGLLVPMLQWALKRCAEERIHMLEAVGFGPEKREMIRKLAPYKRRLSAWLYFYKTQDEALTGWLANPEHWDPSMFDGDSSL